MTFRFRPTDPGRNRNHARALDLIQTMSPVGRTETYRDSIEPPLYQRRYALRRIDATHRNGRHSSLQYASREDRAAPLQLTTHERHAQSTQLHPRFEPSTACVGGRT